ncbi:hypothetical protein FOA52_006023 [Chlamydomonas sp. UWO 241]|nr:hypothetical protein FOA52_006023 [Chlamydomonas sp. UWO 241]
MPHELVEACLVCVAPMERKHLGWACSQYCAHHTIINDKEQSMDCVECLAADLPTDKWYCHVCMEQVIHSMDARRQCYACTQSGTDGYECATCGKVGNMEERAKCFECIKGGGKATECSKDYVKMPGYTKPPKTKAATPEAKLTSAEHPAAHADTL